MAYVLITNPNISISKKKYKKLTYHEQQLYRLSGVTYFEQEEEDDEPLPDNIVSIGGIVTETILDVDDTPSPAHEDDIFNGFSAGSSQDY